MTKHNATETTPVRKPRVMAESGVDISGYRSKTFDAVRDVPFDRVITVCGHANEK